jgi:hypothetical protein
MREKIQFLQEELITKREEYSEKIEKYQKKMKEDSQMKNKKADDKYEVVLKKESYDQTKMTKFTDLYKNTKSYTIVEGISKDYSKLTSEIDKIFFEEEKIRTNEDAGFVYVKYEEITVPFRVIDEYYTYADLLVESCRFFDCKPDKNRIFEHSGNIINMSLSVKEHMTYMKESTGSVPNLILLPITDEVELDVKNGKEDEEDSKKDSNDTMTANLLKDIDQVEIVLLQKIRQIMFYLLFLLVVFVFTLINAQIHQQYHITRAITNQVLNNKYYQQNPFALENSFLTMNKLNDLINWGPGAFVNIFDFPEESDTLNAYYDSHSNETKITKILGEYIVIGKIKLQNLRLVKVITFFIFKE